MSDRFSQKEAGQSNVSFHPNGQQLAYVDILQAADGGHPTSGRLDRQSGNDAFMTVVVDADSSTLVPGGVWNVLEPDIRDPAPYLSRVLVHSSPATSVGLSAFVCGVWG